METMLFLLTEEEIEALKLKDESCSSKAFFPKSATRDDDSVVTASSENQ